MTTAKKASYVLFGVLALGVILLNLGPVLLAGLFSFMILDSTHQKLKSHMNQLMSRGLSVVIFVITAALLFWMIWSYVKLTLMRTPDILASLIPKIDVLFNRYGIDLPFENLHQVRVALIEVVKENAKTVSQTSSLVTRQFFQVFVGVFVAILCFLRDRSQAYKDNLFDAVRREFDQRVKVFMLGFEKVFGAQVLISLINTGVTFVFLLSTGMPYVRFLTMTTFIFGIIPILGNILSNAVIVGTALTVSPHLALIAFIFLVVAHKAQYFLNSQIIGSRINTPMWMIMLGLLIGERLMGIAGMIIAPAMLHYIREEMQAIPMKASHQSA